jgi:HD-GYP domain-containing protein (c-di-GMP phosphodiesterase class II)
MPYLTTEELRYLRLARGTLDGLERAEIESHVEETYQFLIKIPWTDDLRNLADYAYGHHEKLNGTGYPRQLAGDEIPVQTRIITLADIFDALTESDRPYKAAVSPERALDILRAEAKEGLLDGDLVQILLESESYRRILEEDWRQF